MSATATPQVAEQLERRRAAVADEWQDRDEVVLIGAGQPIHRPGRDDLVYLFEAHSEYFYLTDRNTPGGVLAFDPADGWTHFAAPITVADRLWSGATGGDEGPTTDDLPRWLNARASQPLAWLGTPLPGTETDPDLAQDLRFGLSSVRRVKDAVELSRMKAAQQATKAAFAVAVPLLQEGASERDVQVELEAEAFRHGAESMAYDTIIGGGPNSAVLHFMPTARQFQRGELVLIDAGAQYCCYASDITRTYPVGGTFTPTQQELHTIVNRSKLSALDHCRAGNEWRDVHLAAARSLAEDLVAFGLLNGAPDALIESGAIWLFFPHGIGHLLGLGVRDAGGTPLPERRNEPKPYPNLRIDMPLTAGMVVTVEPGVYFVPAILNDPHNRELHRATVAWEMVDRMLDFGGIRIEDNVLITGDAGEVITADVPLLG